MSDSLESQFGMAGLKGFAVKLNQRLKNRDGKCKLQDFG